MNKTAVFYAILITIIILALIISSDLNKPPDLKPRFANYITEQFLSKDTTNTYGQNLQVLHGIHSKDQLLNVMQGFTEALGVKCVFCHNIQDFASDENPHKITARLMIRMDTYIDKHFLESPDMKKVTCFTCHRGQSIPKLVAER